MRPFRARSIVTDNNNKSGASPLANILSPLGLEVLLQIIIISQRLQPFLIFIPFGTGSIVTNNNNKPEA